MGARMQRITTLIILISLFTIAIAIVGEAIQLLIIAVALAVLVFLLAQGIGDDR